MNTSDSELSTVRSLNERLNALYASFNDPKKSAAELSAIEKEIVKIERHIDSLLKPSEQLHTSPGTRATVTMDPSLILGDTLAEREKKLWPFLLLVGAGVAAYLSMRG